MRTMSLAPVLNLGSLMPALSQVSRIGALRDARIARIARRLAPLAGIESAAPGGRGPGSGPERDPLGARPPAAAEAGAARPVAGHAGWADG